MITYFIKSTICMMVLYAFYHFFLHYYKILIFNRIYLISSLIFSLVIPLIVIPINSDFMLTGSLDRLTISVGNFVGEGQMVRNNSSSYISYSIILFSFILCSTVFLVRFGINIFKILRKITICEKINLVNITLVLIEGKTLPHSFFKYVFVNKSDFQNNRIPNELLVHEETHCNQYHSVDIILLELINIFFWFNPAIWFFRKAIILNHEYIADNEVIATNELYDYNILLVNLILQNNTNFLVSNFKYSLIKNRIIMMTKVQPSNTAILRKIAGILLFIVLGVSFTFSQVKKINSDSSSPVVATAVQQDSSFDTWWKSIAKKHNITYESFTVHEPFVIFGKKTVDNDTETFNDVVAIGKGIGFKKGENIYSIIKSDKASYGYDTKYKHVALNINNCVVEQFDGNSNSIEPTESRTLKIFGAEMADFQTK